MKKYLILLMALGLITSCEKEELTQDVTTVTPTTDKLIVINEGIWQSDNSQLSYVADGVATNNWFSLKNPGMKLGDTANDIIQCNDTLVAITVNQSNIIEYIKPTGEHITATEDIPNNRCMVSDGNYLYVTSYGHKCGSYNFTKGFVAKIDLRTKKVVTCTEVGWEPDGIKLYKGKLFVLNTGGYAGQENHSYESTVSIIDANSMKLVKTVDVGAINLFGDVSQCGKYLCINSSGDFYSTPAATVVFDCETYDFRKLNFPSTYNATFKDKFICIGSEYSSTTGEMKYNLVYLNPEDLSTQELPEDMAKSIKSMTSPHEVYVSPYTNKVYVTDAGNYTSAGTLYQFSSEGALESKYSLYIAPSRMVSVK